MATLTVARRRKRDADRKRKQRATAKKAAKKAPAKKAAKRAPMMTTPALAERGRMSIAKGIGAFLEECRAAKSGQNGNWSRKPETIQASIDLHTKKLAEAPTAIAEIKERAILRELNDALERAGGTEDEMTAAKKTFIEHGAAWAATNSIPYAVFREMGVPPSALKEAGISK